MLDRQKAGQFAMDAIDSIAESYEGREIETGEMMLLVEISAEEDGESTTQVMSYCSDDRVFVQWGMLHAALASEERE